MHNRVPIITEIFLLVNPFFSPSPKVVAKQKAGLYGGIINEIAKHPNQVLVIIPPDLSEWKPLVRERNKRSLEKLSKHAVELLGDRLFMPGRYPLSFSPELNLLNSHKIKLAKSVKAIGLGEHGGNPEHCVHEQCSILCSMLRRKGHESKSVYQFAVLTKEEDKFQAHFVEKPEWTIVGGKSETIAMADDLTLREWNQRRRRLKKQGVLKRYMFGRNKRK